MCRVAVGCVLYHSDAFLKSLLSEAATRPSVDLFLADNSDSAPSANRLWQTIQGYSPKVVQDAGGAVVVLKSGARIFMRVNTHNPGFGAAANFLVDWAANKGHSQIVLVNPDIAHDFSLYQRLARQLDDLPDAFCVAPCTVTPGVAGISVAIRFYVLLAAARRITRLKPKNAPCRAPNRVLLASEFAFGSCLVLNIPRFRTLKGFDEGYFLYVEEIDLQHRARRRNWQTYVDLRECVVHKSDNFTTSGASRTPTFWYYDTRNSIRYVRQLTGPVRATGAALVTIVLRAVVARLRPHLVRSMVKGALHAFYDSKRR